MLYNIFDIVTQNLLSIYDRILRKFTPYVSYQFLYCISSVLTIIPDLYSIGVFRDEFYRKYLWSVGSFGLTCIANQN